MADEYQNEHTRAERFGEKKTNNKNDELHVDLSRDFNPVADHAIFSFLVMKRLGMKKQKKVWS